MYSNWGQRCQVLGSVQLPLTAVSKKETLPQSVNGIPTDVEEVGLIVPLARKAARKAPRAVAAMPNPQSKLRPAQPGHQLDFANRTTLSSWQGRLAS